MSPLWNNIRSFTIKAAISLLSVATLLFFLFNVLPSDPAALIAGPHADAFQLELARQKLGLDASLGMRYLLFINDLNVIGFTQNGVRLEDWMSISTMKVGDVYISLKLPFLGRSFSVEDTVGALLREGFFETLVLVMASLIIAGFIGIPLGVLTARRMGGALDHAVQSLSAVGLALPSFVAAIFLAWTLGYLLNDWLHLPVTGSLFKYNVYTQEDELMLKHLILPALALSIRPIAVTSQLMLNSMIDVLEQDYIRTARAKGLSEIVVLYNHALRNAIGPVLSAFTGWFTALMAGAMFVEYIFGWKGLGSLLLTAIEHQDFPVIIGITLVLSSVYIVVDGLLSIILRSLNPTLIRPR